MQDLHLLRPYWLLALLPLVLLLIQCGRNKGKANQWQQQVDPELLPHLLVGQSSVTSNNYLLAIALLWSLAVVALAGPSWEKLPSPVYRSLQERVLVVDLSLSMDAQDVKPSRLQRIKQKLQDILDQSADSQTALVVFSAVPYVVAPLTDDVQTIKSLLPSLATDIVPAQGSSVALALKKGFELLQQSGSNNGSLWLLTDSSPDEGSDQIALEINQAGYTVNVLGVGSAEGAPIPTSRGGFVKDAQDNIVIAKLDNGALRRLSRRGGGVYEQTSRTNSDVKALLTADRSLNNNTDADGPSRQADIWLERGPFIVLLLLPFAAWCFRRDWLS